MSPFVLLFAGHGDHALGVAPLEKLLELAASRGVGAFAHDERTGILPQRHRLIETGHAGLEGCLPRLWFHASNRLDHACQMFGRGAATAADNVDAELVDELTQV